MCEKNPTQLQTLSQQQKTNSRVSFMYFHKQTVVLKFCKIWNLSLYKADFIYSQDAPFVFFYQYNNAVFLQYLMLMVKYPYFQVILHFINKLWFLEGCLFVLLLWHPVFCQSVVSAAYSGPESVKKEAGSDTFLHVSSELGLPENPAVIATQHPKHTCNKSIVSHLITPLPTDSSPNH